MYTATFHACSENSLDCLRHKTELSRILHAYELFLFTLPPALPRSCVLDYPCVTCTSGFSSFGFGFYWLLTLSSLAYRDGLPLHNLSFVLSVESGYLILVTPRMPNVYVHYVMFTVSSTILYDHSAHHSPTLHFDKSTFNFIISSPSGHAQAAKSLPNSMMCFSQIAEK